MPHSLNRDDIDFGVLAEEFSAMLGRNVAVTGRLPGQTDDDGDPLPGVLYVLDDDGDEIQMAAADAQSIIDWHRQTATVEPLTDDEITRLRALLANSA